MVLKKVRFQKFFWEILFSIFILLRNGEFVIVNIFQQVTLLLKFK